MGGFEGADHVNGHGQPLDPNARNGHQTRLEEDYTALAALGIHVVRESIGWRLFDAGGAQSVEALLKQARIAASREIQVIWTLMHYGWPQRLDPFDRPGEFIEAFARHCGELAHLLAGIAGPAPVYQPVNEISFLSWAASQTGLIHPYLPSGPERARQLKRVLVSAALRAMDAIRSAAPGARFIHTDPLIHVMPPRGAGPVACAAACAEHEGQFEAWDMLCGRVAPELGGAPHYLDLVGINYYHNNQWEHGSGQGLHWHRQDSRRRPFHLLAEALWQRYRRPLCITETGHVGEGRAQWFDEMVAEVATCNARGIPIDGLCLYPLIDRPDWQIHGHWHQSGLWDVPRADEGDFNRRLHQPYADRLLHWQQVWRCQDMSFLHSPTETPMTSIIVFSHLRWDFVYQRPQQLLSRLARKHPIVFVEEPWHGAERSRLEIYSPCAGVQVLRMHVTGTAPGFDDMHMQAMRSMLSEYLMREGIDEYLLWFYTPMAVPLAEGLAPRGSIYDCMDELSAFAFAPPALVEREAALFEKVDLVFTGGRSLYESKRSKHDEVHCFPSSVDHEHFGQRDLPDHPDQAALARPRLGYYGVIDERIDLGLVAALADAHPEWQIVMVGPLAKVDPAQLPQRSNVYWMGQRRYDELPAFLSGWDVCLMPFALNASTRFISPTKTLEYLAAGKPVVSTPVTDVAAQYSAVVPIAATAAEFVAACEDILSQTQEERTLFENGAAVAVAATSWDQTARAIAQLLERFETAPHISTPVPLRPSVQAQPTSVV